MVKLFSKKKEEKSKEFKFETSIKLKDLPIEEYSHLSFAFQTAILRFERMLKESLLEGFITSTTLERISREFKIEDIREMEVPKTESLIKLFGDKEPIELAKITTAPTPAVKPTIPVTSSPIAKPVTPTATMPTSKTATSPQATISTEPSPIPAAPTEAHPKISFSFPETTTPPQQPSPQIQQPTKPLSQPAAQPVTREEPTTTSPQIPKISFPTLTKVPSGTPSDPIVRSKSHREEDRATGIAILRKQMLTELKKIRSVVSENER